MDANCAIVACLASSFATATRRTVLTIGQPPAGSVKWNTPISQSAATWETPSSHVLGCACGCELVSVQGDQRPLSSAVNMGEQSPLSLDSELGPGQDHHDKDHLPDVPGTPVISADMIHPPNTDRMTSAHQASALPKSPSTMTMMSSDGGQPIGSRGKERAGLPMADENKRPLCLLDLPTDVLREIVRQVCEQI